MKINLNALCTLQMPLLSSKWSYFYCVLFTLAYSDLNPSPFIWYFIMETVNADDVTAIEKNEAIASFCITVSIV